MNVIKALPPLILLFAVAEAALDSKIILTKPSFCPPVYHYVGLYSKNKQLLPVFLKEFDFNFTFGRMALNY